MKKQTKNSNTFYSLDREYVWKTFIQWFKPLLSSKYLSYLKRRCFNYLLFTNNKYPNIINQPSLSTTLKFPHTSKLRKVKCNLFVFFQRMIDELFPNQNIILISNPELHECHLQCHYLEITSKQGIKFKKHSKNLCRCSNKHRNCKKDWHLMVRHELGIDFAKWPHQHHQETINPKQMIYVKALGYEIDQLTMKLCYEMKTWISFYDKESIAEFKRHGFNPERQKGYFVYDSTDQNHRSDYKKIFARYVYYQQNKLSKQWISQQSELKSTKKKIERINSQINKSRSQQTSCLRQKKQELVYQNLQAKNSLIRYLYKKEHQSDNRIRYNLLKLKSKLKKKILDNPNSQLLSKWNRRLIELAKSLSKKD